MGKRDAERPQGAKVGIFFVVGDELLVDAVPVRQGETYGMAIQHGEHYRFWGSLLPRTNGERRFKERAYDAYPRGRVVFFPREGRTCLYADRCLTEEHLRAVFTVFGLDRAAIRFDEHYRCAGCNPDYTE